MPSEVDALSFAELVQRFGEYLDELNAALEAGGGDGQPALSALPLATAADAGSGNLMVGLKPDGTAARFTTKMFASRRTQDLARLTQLLGDEVIPNFSAQRFSATGEGDGAFSVGDIAAQIQGTLNPKISYGAKGDGRFANDGQTNAGSAIVSSADGPFRPTDVGKTIVMSNAKGSNWLQSTIIRYVSATEVEIAETPNTTFSRQEFLWGTDDTVAIQSWLNALAGPGRYNFGRVGLLPEGIYLTKTLKYGARMAIRGAGQGATTLALLPGGTGAHLEPTSNLVDFPIIQNMSMRGGRYLGAASTRGLEFISVTGGSTALAQLDPNPYFSDLDIDGYGGVGLYHGNRGAGTVRDVRVRGGGSYGMVCQGYDMTFTNIIANSNRLTGIYFGRFGAANCSLRSWYAYFNGNNPFQQFSGGIVDSGTIGNIAWEDASNVFIGGVGMQIGSGRAQESWGPNITVGGTRNHITEVRCDDTGCSRPRHSLGRTNLMSARPSIMFVGTNCNKNVVRGLVVDSSVHVEENYGTHAVFFSGNADKNSVEIEEEPEFPAYYGNGAGAYAPGRIGTDSSNGYMTNNVTINRQTVL